VAIAGDPAPGDARIPAHFRRLIAAWAGSLTADGLRIVALPLLAASIDRSPAAVAAVAGFTALPWLVIAVPAGALVDRLNPARAQLAAHLARAVLTAGLAGAAAWHWRSIALLCAIGFLITSAETVADSAAQSLMVRTVPSAALERANARFVTVETVALDLVGPLTGGVLFAVMPWLPFAVSAVLFVAAAIAVVPLAGLPELSVPAAGDGQPDIHRVTSGLRELARNPVLRILVVTVAVMALGNAAADGQLVLYATGPLGLSDALYPTLLAAYSVGTLIAAAIVGRLSRRFPSGALMMIALAGIGGTLLVLGLAPTPAVGWTCYGLMGLAGGTWNVLSATRRQRHTRHALIARVSSAFRVIAWGMNPIGAAVGGGIGEAWGVAAVFTVAGAVILVWGIVVARAFLRPEPPAVHDASRTQPPASLHPGDPPLD
jgi:MFS family permease